MELAFSTVKKFTMSKTTDAQIQPDAVELVGERLQEIAQELGVVACTIAVADGRKRIMKEHMAQAINSYMLVKAAEQRKAEEDAAPAAPEKKYNNVGSRAEQLLAMANRDLIKLGKKPYLLGSAREAKSE